MDLVKRYREFLSSPVGKTLSTVGRVAQAVTNPVGTAINFGARQAVQSPQIQRPVQNFMQQASSNIQMGKPVFNNPNTKHKTAPQGAKLIHDYAKGQVISPIQQGIQGLQKPGLLNKTLGGLQVAGGVISGTPQGILFNTGNAALTELTKSVRTKKGLQDESFRKALTTPTSLATEGLGIQNPYVATVADLALSRSPKAIIKDPTGFKGAKKLVQAIKGMTGGPNAKGVVPKKNYIDHVLEHEVGIDDVVRRYEQLQPLANTGAGGIRLPDIQGDNVLIDDATYIWHEIFGKDKKPPETLGEIVGDLNDAWSGARTEMKMRQQGIQLGFAANKDIQPETPKMPKEIQALQNMVDEGKLIQPKNYAKLMQWKEQNQPKPLSEGQLMGQVYKDVPVSPLPDQRGNKSNDSSNEAPPPNGVENPTDPFYNVNRIGISDADRQFVKETVTSAQVKNLMNKTPITFKDVDARAESSPMLDKTMTRDETLNLGAQAKVLRDKVAELSELGVADDKYIEVLVKDKAFGRFLAQLLGQRRMMSDPKNKTMYNQMIGKILKEGHDPDEVIKAAKGVNFDNPNETVKFYRSFIKPNIGDWIDKLRYNSMLSSPMTGIVNASSNLQGTGLLTPVQKTVEGMVDAVVSGVSGKDRTRYTGEGLSYAAGYAMATGKAFKKLFATFKNPMQDMDDTRQIRATTGGVGRAIENTLDLPNRINNAVDQFFGELVRGGLEASYGHRLHKSNKLDSNMDIDAEVEKQLFKNKLTEEGAGIVSNALGAGGNIVKAATQSNNKTIRWMAKLTLPFLNIGTNLAKVGAEYNPALGTLNMIGNKDKTAQASKIAIGSVVTLAGAALAMNDNLTFGEPRGEKEKQAWKDTGIQAYSIKIGDEWRQYSKLHPALAFQLATSAAVISSLKEGKITEDAAERFVTGAWNSLQFIADATYFKNVGDFVSTVEGDVEGLSKLTSNYPSQFIPFRGTLSWLNRMLDEYQRKPDTSADFATRTFQQMAAQLPGVSQNVPVREGVEGQPIPNQHRIYNSFIPVRKSTEDPYKRQTYDVVHEKAKETRDINALKEEVKKSSGMAEAHGKYIYFDRESGETRTIDINKQVEAPKLTGYDELDKKLISKYKSALTAKENDIRELYNLGKLTAEEAETALKAIKGKKLATGGGRKGRRPTFVKFKTPKLKLVKSKPVKIKKVKQIKSKKIAIKAKVKQVRKLS